MQNHRRCALLILSLSSILTSNLRGDTLELHYSVDEAATSARSSVQTGGTITILGGDFTASFYDVRSPGSGSTSFTRTLGPSTGQIGSGFASNYSHASSGGFGISGPDEFGEANIGSPPSYSPYYQAGPDGRLDGGMDGLTNAESRFDLDSLSELQLDLGSATRTVQAQVARFDYNNNAYSFLLPDGSTYQIGLNFKTISSLGSFSIDSLAVEQASPASLYNKQGLEQQTLHPIPFNDNDHPNFPGSSVQNLSEIDQLAPHLQYSGQFDSDLTGSLDFTLSSPFGLDIVELRDGTLASFQDILFSELDSSIQSYLYAFHKASANSDYDDSDMLLVVNGLRTEDLTLTESFSVPINITVLPRNGHYWAMEFSATFDFKIDMEVLLQTSLSIHSDTLPNSVNKVTVVPEVSSISLLVSATLIGIAIQKNRRKSRPTA